MSDALDRIAKRIRANVSAHPDGAIDIERERAAMDALGRLPPRAEGTTFEETTLGGRPCDIITPAEKTSDARILYFHGGAFALGSPAAYRTMLSHLAKACGARVWCVDYRRAPEHPFPAAIDDALSAWREFSANENGFVMGDSCGGNLALVTLVRATTEGLPSARGAVLLSPWIDLEMRGASVKTNAESDPLIREGDSRAYAKLYLNGRSPSDPLASPLHADLVGLPPIYVQVARGEILYDDSTRLAEKTPIEIDASDHALHVWQLLAGILPEADEAMTRIAKFVARH